MSYTVTINIAGRGTPLLGGGGGISRAHVV